MDQRWPIDPRGWIRLQPIHQDQDQPQHDAQQQQHTIPHDDDQHLVARDTTSTNNPPHRKKIERQSSLPFAPPESALLPETMLSDKQIHLDERIRTLCLVVCATAVVFAALLYLRAILVPLFLAIALRYTLTPLINLLTCHHSLAAVSDGATPHCSARFALPRAFAIATALLVSVAVVTLIGFLLARSIGAFAAKAGVYNARIEEIVDYTFAEIKRIQEWLEPGNATSVVAAESVAAVSANATAAAPPTTDHGLELLEAYARSINVSNKALEWVGTAASVAEDTLYIVLFLVFMLCGEDVLQEQRHRAQKSADEQIYAYILGKLALSLMMGLAHAGVLAWVGLDLWLVFGCLTFCLNLIPVIGLIVAVFLPMPLVALDPAFSQLDTALAFLVPAVLGTLNKDVIEPRVLGKATKLNPVAVLLTIMLWGAVWGVTGMILAVPITAAGRIYLKHVDHPLCRYVVIMLGDEEPRSPGNRSTSVLDSPRASFSAAAAASTAQWARLP